MRQNPDNGAWLEMPGRESVALGTHCGIGRSSVNEIVLNDERVSRRHAFVHAQGQGEFWVVDLGSRNGTYLDGRRVVQPTRLADGNQIVIGPFMLTFHQELRGSDSTEAAADLTKTLQAVRTLDCWLLVTDIRRYTELAQRLPPDELPEVTGRWFDRCKGILEAECGLIDKYLGDGFFAYWPDRSGQVEKVVRAVEALRDVQATAEPAFRFVLHYGSVHIGSMLTMGNASLFGPEVNFTFRMERLGSALAEERLLSQSAADRTRDLLTSRPIGAHPVPGFGGQFAFFAW